jgi:ParB-like chromosome segregation protein Spo0J
MGQEGEFGLIVSYPTLKNTIISSKQQQLQKNSEELKMQSERKEESLSSVLHLEVRDKSTYVIIDGFHRYRVCKENENIQESTNGCLPVVVIDKPISNRMASTIRHNRARGTHQIGSMADIVSQLYISGWSNKKIAEELGMDKDEINRLKQFTGLGILFKNYAFSKAEEDEIEFNWKFRKNAFK